ncbi:MAG: hypothetical protein WBN32_10475, partial [Woeseia sp.]
MRHLHVYMALIAIAGCDQFEVSAPLPPPPAEQPVGVPTRELAGLQEVSSASTYQPGQPLTISVDLDVADNSAGNAEIDDVFLAAEFAKLHFVMVNKATFDAQENSTELVNVHAVDDVAFENSTATNTSVELTFQIPFDISNSGTYLLASFADSPNQPVVESQYANMFLQSASQITVKTIDLEIDATRPYHDIELNEIEIDEATFVVDVNALEDLDISAAFSSTYWGVAGYVPVDVTEGVKVGEPRRGAVKLEVMIEGVWEALTFAKTVSEIDTLPNDQIEIEYVQPGEELGFSVTGTLPLALLTRIIDNATGGVDVATLDPLVAVAQVPLRVTLIDPLAESENLSDNNSLELSLPLHVMQSEADPLATVPPTNALMKSDTLRLPSIPMKVGPGICPPRGIAATRRFSKSFGSAKTFWASMSQEVRNSDMPTDRSTTISSTSSARLFRSRALEIHYFQLKAKVEPNQNSASGSLRLFGQTIWSAGATGIFTQDFPYPLSFPLAEKRKDIIESKFTIGPFPLIVTVGVAIEASLDGKVTLDDSLKLTAFAPFVSEEVYVFGGFNFGRWQLGPKVAGVLSETSIDTYYNLDLRDTDEDGFCDTSTNIDFVVRALGLKFGISLREETPLKLKWCRKFIWPGIPIPYPCGWKPVGKNKYTYQTKWLWSSNFVFNKEWPIWKVNLDRTSISEILEIKASLQAGFSRQRIDVTGTWLSDDIKITTDACDNISGGTGNGSSRMFWCENPVAVGSRPVQYPVIVENSGKTFTDFHLIVTPAPIITEVTPLEAVGDQETTFTVSGNFLTKDIEFKIDSCVTPTLLNGGTAIERQFTCILKAENSWNGTVTNGTTEFSFTVTSPNLAPIADAGADQAVAAGSVV